MSKLDNQFARAKLFSHHDHIITALRLVQDFAFLDPCSVRGRRTNLESPRLGIWLASTAFAFHAITSWLSGGLPARISEIAHPHLAHRHLALPGGTLTSISHRPWISYRQITHPGLTNGGTPLPESANTLARLQQTPPASPAIGLLAIINHAHLSRILTCCS